MRLFAPHCRRSAERTRAFKSTARRAGLTPRGMHARRAGCAVLHAARAPWSKASPDVVLPWHGMQCAAPGTARQGVGVRHADQRTVGRVARTEPAKRSGEGPVLPRPPVPAACLPGVVPSFGGTMGIPRAGQTLGPGQRNYSPTSQSGLHHRAALCGLCRAHLCDHADERWTSGIAMSSGNEGGGLSSAGAARVNE